MRDTLRELVRDTDDPSLLRDALTFTLDYLDELAERRHEDGIYVAVYTRQLIGRGLRGQTSIGTSQPPEVPSE